MANIKIRNASNTGWIDGNTNGMKFRNSANNGWVTKPAGLAGVSIRNANNTGWITFAGAPSSYTITPNVSSVNEGGTVTYTITTTGFGSGTLYWTNGGSTIGSDFSDSLNSGSITITSNSGTLSRTLNNDGLTEGSETIIIQLRTGSTSGTIVATASSVTVGDTSTSFTFPSNVTLSRNDLEFVYSDYKTSSNSSSYIELQYTMDTTNYFNKATNDAVDHIVLAALDPRGDSSVMYSNGTRDHCGQIARHGQPLWDGSRGFILFRGGRMAAEHWYDGAGIALGVDGFGFSPITHPVFTVKIRAGYRTGTYAESMELWVYQGTSTAGTLLANIYVPWGWDYTGNHRFAIACIASGHVDPSATGCIETTAQPAVTNGATLAISNLSFNVLT